jgi:hypothetical protein
MTWSRASLRFPITSCISLVLCKARATLRRGQRGRAPRMFDRGILRAGQLRDIITCKLGDHPRRIRDMTWPLPCDVPRFDTHASADPFGSMITAQAPGAPVVSKVRGAKRIPGAILSSRSWVIPSFRTRPFHATSRRGLQRACN